MNSAPDISVVMGVYNGGPRLPETIESILSQEDVNFEFIIVNDGSTDQTLDVLESYARRDTRVRIIHQENQGLTKSLIKGCAKANGAYLARQDAGDLSSPGRLSKQLGALKSNPDACVISAGTRFVAPDHEHLYDVLPDESDLTEDLLTLELDQIRGPSMHGCTMFRKDAYEQVGGYRASFYFAQDLDLWIRLAEVGKHATLGEILYEASLTIGSISSHYRKQQVETARLILESARVRRAGIADEEVLQKAARIRTNGKRKPGRYERANALYFIGACLRQRRNPQASDYFHRALQTHPLHLKSALRLLTG